jgi:small subunit ribosomal protein S1
LSEKNLDQSQDQNQQEQEPKSTEDNKPENENKEQPAKKESTSEHEDKPTTEASSREESEPAQPEPTSEPQSGESTEQQEQQEDTNVAVAEADSESETTESTEEVQTAHDDFDWDIEKDTHDQYDDKELKQIEEMYENTLTTIEENEIVKGIVVNVTDSDVVVNIGFKSDGLIPTSEFRDREEPLKEGEEIEVYVERTEDEKGQLQLSRRKAKLMRAWEAIVDAYNNDTIVKGKIVSKTKGGLITNVYGLETFLPGSQIDVKPIIDYDAYVGKTMEFKVVKINEAINNAVVSHKALIESDIEQQRQEIISKLEKGQVLEGTVKNITDFGAFIDLGGVDGLLYITDISWGRISHPSEVLELNQDLNVVVLDFDDEKKRISLGLKQLEPHPWDVLDESIKEGATVKGKIVNIEDYGAFLEIIPGVEGLIHVSEVSWSNQPINAKEYFNVGDEYEAKVMTIDREERKMSLSIKQLEPDPWEKVEEKYPVGSKHTGEVKNITPYGVFVELDEYIGGMIHISDLSWIKRFNHPSEYTKVGENLDVIVLEIDKEGRKLSLGHKQLEEDPWDTFEEVFPVGSIHEATILKRDDKGAIVQLPYGLEAFAPGKHLKKEDGGSLDTDDTADFKIIEFDQDDKRIIVSHTRAVQASKDEEKGEEKKRQGGEKKEKGTETTWEMYKREAQSRAAARLTATEGAGGGGGGGGKEE